VNKVVLAALYGVESFYANYSLGVLIVKMRKLQLIEPVLIEEELDVITACSQNICFVQTNYCS
jgi:hypothetical protein